MAATLADELRELARQAQKKRDGEARKWAEGLLEQITLECRAAAAGGRDGLNFTVTPPPGWRRSDMPLLEQEMRALGKKTGLGLTLSDPDKEESFGMLVKFPSLDIDPPLKPLILRISWRG